MVGAGRDGQNCRGKRPSEVVKTLHCRRGRLPNASGVRGLTNEIIISMAFHHLQNSIGDQYDPPGHFAG